MKYESFDNEEYNRKQVIDFLNEIKLYKIPDNLRVKNNENLYSISIKQANDFLNGNMSLKELKNPDNTLRNIMLLWCIDKQRCEKKRT